MVVRRSAGPPDRPPISGRLSGLSSPPLLVYLIGIGCLYYLVLPGAMRM
jgi:hypothetical protein